MVRTPLRHFGTHVYRQQRERLGFVQADEHEVPLVRAPDGTVRISQETQDQSIGRVAPRESNKEADALANGVIDGFNPELELKVDVANLKWSILPDALDARRQRNLTRWPRSMVSFQTERGRRDGINLRTDLE